MPLAARQADMATAVAALKTVVANCDSDLASADPESNDIQRLKEIAVAALLTGGIDSTVWN